MIDEETLDARLHAHARQRAERRSLFRAMIGAAVVGGTFAYASSASAQAVTDADILNFALNLEYLEANYYYLAVYGTPIPATSMTGTVGTQGAVNFTGATAVPFAVGDSYFSAADGQIIGEFAREIAQDELNHVNFLRSQLMGAAVAQPAIDLSVSPTSAFSKAAQAATFISSTQSFNPYANVINFLYGAFLFEDVGVTAYKGASPLISSKAYLDAAAGILATEAHHAGLIRTSIDSVGDKPGLKGATIRDDTELVSNARDSLDGATDDDQGIKQSNPSTGLTSNIVPADNNAVAFSRTTGQVLNIVYLTPYNLTMGGFFPAGVNGNIKQAAGSAPPAST